MQAPLPDEVDLIIARYTSGLQSLTELTHIALSRYEPSIAQESVLLKESVDAVLSIFLGALVFHQKFKDYPRDTCIAMVKEVDKLSVKNFDLFNAALNSEKTPEELEAYLKELCIINAEECQ